MAKGAGAPRKPKLHYFPHEIGYYEDDKIFDLMERYGPIGDSVYHALLTVVYNEGYYIEIEPEKLAKMIVRKIGSRWVSQKVVVQVIRYLADIGLISKALLPDKVITSVGIQSRYHGIAVKQMKRQLYSDKYLMVDAETGQPLLNTPILPISSEENAISSEEITFNSEENPIETKLNKTKEKNIAHTPNTLFEYLWSLYPERKGKSRVGQKNKKELYDIGQEEMERAIHRYIDEWEKDKEWRQLQNGSTFFNGGYKDYLDANFVPSSPKAAKPTHFQDFDQRTYDYDALMAKLHVKNRKEADRDGQ